jgi:hypothetical protein
MSFIEREHVHSPYHTRGDAMNVESEIEKLNAASRQEPVRVYPTFETRETKTPLCLISTWENGALPHYAIPMVHSLSQNGGFVKLFLFHHKAGPSAVELQSFFNSSFLHVVDVGKLHPSYEEGGITRFATDRVCQIHNIR